MHIPEKLTINRYPLATRKGLTLIELLVVIAIISVLLSLTAGAVFRVVGVINHGNTTRTIMKVEAAYGRMISRLREEANTRDPADYPFYPNPSLQTNPYALAGGTYDRERRRARVIFLKYLLKWSFPMTFREVWENIRFDAATQSVAGHPNAAAIYNAIREQINKDDPTLYNPVTGEIQAVNRALIQDRSAGFDRRPYSFTESAAIMAALYGLVGKTDELTSVEYQDTDGDGVFELCDAWGTPLRLYRWPTGDLRVERAFADKAGIDADDPDRLLGHPLLMPEFNNPSWVFESRQQGRYWPQAVLFETLFHELNHRLHFQGQSSHPLFYKQIYAPMVIVAAGPSGKFGLGYARKQTDSSRLVPDPSMRRMGDSYSTLGYAAADDDALLQNPAVNESWENELDNTYSYRLRLGVTGQ